MLPGAATLRPTSKSWTPQARRKRFHRWLRSRRAFLSFIAAIGDRFVSASWRSTVTITLKSMQPAPKWRVFR